MAKAINPDIVVADLIASAGRRGCEFIEVGVGSVQFVTRDCAGRDLKAFYVPLDAEHAISVAAAKRISDARAICLRNKSV